MSRDVADALAGLMPAAALFRSLADPARPAITRHLAAGEARVVDVTGVLGLAQSTASAHLACLRARRLVDARPAGRASVYSLRQPAQPAQPGLPGLPGLPALPALPGLPGLLAAAEAVLEATGNAVALCPHYGQAR